MEVSLMQKLNILPLLNVDYRTSEEIKKLRTNISLLGSEVKVINIVSTMGKEGKSMLSFWISNSLAEAGKKVVYIDGNLRETEKHNAFEINKDHENSENTKTILLNSLTDYLLGNAKKEDIIYESNIPNLDFILLTKGVKNSSELLSLSYFADLLKHLRNQYDYVIIDTPSIGEVTDGIIIAKYCDGNIMVIEPGIVPYKLAQKVKDQIEKSGSKVLGVILNKVQR